MTVGLMIVPEPVIRLSAFFVIFVAMAAFELVSPRLERPEMRAAMKSRRWLTNVGLVVVSSLVLRVIFPAAAVGAALWASARGYGVFSALPAPQWVAGIVTFIVLDFAVWAEHVASHRLPILWRIHCVHHSDTGFDVTTALRFHPMEIVLSMLWKAGIVIALGPPAWSVLLFEIVLNGAAMFNHANLRIPARLDAFLRMAIVTPDMHRVHHSTDRRETDTNYGFNFSFWDRLFSTYSPTPALGQDNMEIGLAEFRETRTARLFWTLALPFRRN